MSNNHSSNNHSRSPFMPKGVVFEKGVIELLHRIAAESGILGKTRINQKVPQIDNHGNPLPAGQVRAKISTEIDPKRNLWRLTGDLQLNREMELKERTREEFAGTGRKEAK